MTQVSRRFRDSPEHPWVAVDVAIYTVSRRALRCLLIQVKEGPFAGMWAFPGGLVGAEESLDRAADRELLERTGVKQGYLEQLYTFGKPERDPALRVVSASYLALAPDSKIRLTAAPKYADIRWFPANLCRASPTTTTRSAASRSSACAPSCSIRTSSTACCRKSLSWASCKKFTRRSFTAGWTGATSAKRSWPSAC